MKIIQKRVSITHGPIATNVRTIISDVTRYTRLVYGFSCGASIDSFVSWNM